jgi:hypothetical protein
LTNYCYQHPDSETALTCGNCGRPICTRCVVQHPVGIRCPECARPTRIPTLDVTTSYYSRAIAAAVGISVAGIIGLFLLAVLLTQTPLGYIIGDYLIWGALAGIGYLMGRGVSLAVNRKRSLGLQWIAGAATGATFVIATKLIGIELNSLLGIFALVAAIYLASRELRV